MSDTFSGGDIAAAASAVAPESSPVSETTPAADATETVASESAPTTEEPADSGAPSDSHGEPPKERWNTILENARKKAAEEVETRYAWAKEVDQREVEAFRQWNTLAQNNPMMALDRFVQSLAQTPEGVHQLQSYFGRALGQRARQQQQQASGNEMPGPDIPTSESNGQPVVYSAQRMQELLKWQQQQLMSQVQQEISPFKQEREAKLEDARTQAYAQQAISRVTNRPGFAEHKQEIIEAYSRMPIVEGEDEGAKLLQAYLDVVGPRMSFQARQQAVADITRKASASTVNPAAAASSTSFDYKKASIEEALAYEWKKRGGK